MKSLASKILESIPNGFLYRKATHNKSFSLNQMLRDSIVGELDAISLYDVQINSTDNELVKKTLTSIRDEEVVHVGELYSLMKEIDPNLEDKIKSGEDEVSELIYKK